MAQRTFVRDGVIYQDNGDGTATVVGYESQGTPLGAPDPTAPYQAPKAQADAARAQAEAARAMAEAPYAARLAEAETARAQAEAEKARTEANRDPNAQVLDRGKLGQFLALESQLERIKQLYQQGPGSTSGLAGVADYLPSDANAAFNSAGAGLSEVGLAAFRVPGVGSQSDAELRQFIMANTPSAGDRDAAILEKVGNLERRLAATKQAWGVDPSAPAAVLLEQLDRRAGSQDGPNAMTAIRMGGGAQAALPGRGDVGSQMITNPNDIPPELNQEIDQLRARLLSQGGGRLDPQAYAAESAKLAQKYGLVAEDPVAFAESLNQYLDAGGTTIPSGVIPAERLMSATETMKNNLVNNPVGGAIVGASNGIFAGSLDAIAPGEMAAMRDAQPIPMLGGEIGGAIGATVAGGRLAGLAASRVAPRLMQGSQFGRNVAADATYGAVYGQNTQGSPVTGAVIGGLGSAAGQGLNRGIGAAIGGVRRTPEAIALREAGVPISVARQIGGPAARAEDAIQSIPVVGDMSRARQMESFTGFNEAAMRQAGEPIGYAPTQIGAGGVEDFGNAVGNAYTNATRGVTARVDDQTFRDNADVMRAIGDLPGDYQAAARTIMERRIIPALESGNLTGEQFQQALRGIKQARANAGKNPSLAGFEQEFRDSLTGVEDMLTGTMTRGAGPEVAANLNAANAANRGFKTIEDAALNRAKVGTQTGETNVFTPAQLIAAARQSENRGFGNNPLMELGRQGQAVLPSSLPNSGTVDRTLAATGLLGAGGAIGGAAGYDPQNPVSGTAGGASGGLLGAAATGGLLALGGTRRGQDALETLLFQRPEAVRELADIVRRRGGLLGSAGGVMGQQYGY